MPIICMLSVDNTLVCLPSNTFKNPSETIPARLTEQRYRLMSLLGKGTFGMVTLAEQKSTGKLVAIKSLKGPAHTNVNPLDLRETQFFKKVGGHGSLVGLEEMYVDSLTRQVQFVLEAMDFTMLDLIHARRGDYLEPNVIESICAQMLRGLRHIHQHNYVHRDLKPENLLLRHRAETNSLELKIADFGLSREVSASDFDFVWTGYVATRWYRAPEQLLQVSGHGFPLDVWSFGVVIAELCNLRPLFPGKDQHEMLKLQLSVLGSPHESATGGPWRFQVDVGFHGKSRVIIAPQFRLFDRLARACLQWDAKRRPTPERLLYHLKSADKKIGSEVATPKRLHVRSNSIA